MTPRACVVCDRCDHWRILFLTIQLLAFVHAGDTHAAGGGCARAGARVEQGRAVQVDPIKPTLKAPGSERLKLKCDEVLSSVAFNFSLRRYSKATKVGGVKDGGYSLYIDINYADDTHDWGFHLPFNVDTHGWEVVSGYLVERCRMTLSNPR